MRWSLNGSGSSEAFQEAEELAIERHYRTKEVAEMLRVSEDTVLRLFHRGELRAVRVGNELRYPESAVEEFLKRNTEPRRDRRRAGS